MNEEKSFYKVKELADLVGITESVMHRKLKKKPYIDYVATQVINGREVKVVNRDILELLGITDDSQLHRTDEKTESDTDLVEEPIAPPVEGKPIEIQNAFDIALTNLFDKSLSQVIDIVSTRDTEYIDSLKAQISYLQSQVKSLEQENAELRIKLETAKNEQIESLQKKKKKHH